ncbi:histidine kinase [Flavobacterium sp.]|uniref:histidine kinase n=1 Tax=Flavobacterium sp. TaxID=239 RepID=UPI004047757D
MRTLILLFFLIGTNLGLCQNPYFISIDKTSGLPSNSIYDIFQDSKGFMWFATGKGLCRYDGNNFKTFTADFQTSKSGSCIAEDKFGRIWYENFDGYLYYIEKGKLIAFTQQKTIGYFRYGIIKNDLFLIQPGAVFVYDLKSLKVKTKHIITDQQIRFCIATKEKFYVLSDNLYEFGNENSFKTHRLPNNFYREITTPIVNIWNQKLIINSKSNTTYYIYENGKFRKSTLNNSTNFIQNTAITDNIIWLCTPNGIYQNDLISNKNKTYFIDKNISYIFKDQQSNYWISTLNKGVLFLQNFSNNYVDLIPRPNVFALGKKEIYVGAEKDLIYKLNFKTLKTDTLHESESNHSINQIYADTINDHIFFNSFKFNILKNENKIINEYIIAIKDIKKIDEKYFSFAASNINGIFFIDPKKSSSWDKLFNDNKVKSDKNFNHSVLLTNVNGKSTEYNPSNNTLYYATNNGLIAITNDGKSQELKYKNETLFFVKIQKYKDNIIGLSTAEKIYIINKKNEVTTLILPDFIAKEKFNRFFIRNQYCYLFSVNSIYEFDFETQKAQKVLSLSNDIEATDVVLNNNQLFFATSKGIVIKNRFEIGNFPKPKLIINEIQINGKRREINQLKELNPNENDVVINFSTLSFVPNENYNVSYKINNTEWKTLDSKDNNLKLFSLAFGEYKIQLAINYNNSKIELQTIQFEIKKPFWLKPHFLIGLAVVFFFLVYTFYKFQIRKLEKRNQLLLEKVNLEKNLNQSKLKAIKSQMNPHFFYNALNTLQSFILSNEKRLAIDYLSKFSNLTRTILEMTEKDFISIAEEIKTLQLYLDIEKGRFDEDFSYEIQVEKNIDQESIKIPTMLLQPYVENAVKHGLLHKQGNKKLTISFEIKNNELHIGIEDNGIGRQKSSELNQIKNKNHQSFATKALQNRIALLNEYNHKNISLEIIDKYNIQNQPTGTLVEIIIPINNL